MFGFLEVVKHQLRNGGPVQAESFNHLYTLDLYKNTKSKAKLVKTGSGFDMYIQVGYFVPYGQNLEEFTPRIVPLKTLADWATKKNININIQNLRRKLKKNPDYYPILDTLWNDQDYSGLYAKEVLRRLREVWFSA